MRISCCVQLPAVLAITLIKNIDGSYRRETSKSETILNEIAPVRWGEVYQYLIGSISDESIGFQSSCGSIAV